LNLSDMENLKITIAQYNRTSIIKALDNTVSVYKSLRRKLYPATIELQSLAEKRSCDYLKTVKQKNS